jgi:hypothetical protein
MTPKTAAPEHADQDQAERWATDGSRVWRAPGGPTVCVLGDPTQGSLFADADAHQLRDAQLIACAPRLRAALAECAKRLETCCHFSGSAAEYAHLAVKGYRDLIAESHGRHPQAKEQE